MYLHYNIGKSHQDMNYDLLFTYGTTATIYRN